MRYRLTARAYGDVKLGATTQVVNDGLTYRYEAVDGRLASVSVETPVVARDFRSEIQPKTAGEPVIVEFFSDADTHDWLLRELQEIEAHLSFSTHGALEGLDWQRASSERVPDIIAEEALIPARSLMVTQEHPRPSATITTDDLAQISILKGEHGELVGLKTFWREAVNEYHDLRYIQAFYNFFFILEGLYAPGTSRQREVVKGLQSSTELRGYMERILVAALDSERHRAAIQAYCDAYECSFDAAGVLELLVRIRGTLHHFAPKSQRSRIHSFAQAEFQTAAWLTLGLATNSLLMRDRRMPHPPL